MNKDDIAELLRHIPGSGAITIDEPMSRHTSFGIGGPADVFVRPIDRSGLVSVLKVCAENGVPALVMGNGTNLIVRDKGIRGVVIRITDNFSAYKADGEEISAESGILLARLARIALSRELTGLEFAEGIPGTLGGAVAMNAGAYGGEMSLVVGSSEYLAPDGRIYTLDNAGHCFGKRFSFIQADGGVVIKTVIRLKKGNRERINAKMEEFGARRREKQPLGLPSAGSIFKRPEGYFAGKLIQDCGLKGFGVGGAEVSDLHCGFIVNRGNATAQDVVTLIKYIQDKVYDVYGVLLQTEVRIVGEQ